MCSYIIKGIKDSSYNYCSFPECKKYDKESFILHYFLSTGKVDTEFILRTTDSVSIIEEYYKVSLIDLSKAIGNLKIVLNNKYRVDLVETKLKPIPYLMEN